MSETAYERGYRTGTEHSSSNGSAPPSGARAGGITGGLSRKLGPLPMWAWMVIGLAVILGISYWNSRKSANTAGAPSTTNTSDIPQFVNQVYTNASPPGQPGPTGPAGPPGKPGTPTPKPGPKPKPKTPVKVGPFKYTVQKGDTLLSLSQKFLGTTNRTDLAHANGLGTGAGLRAGQIITIPAHSSPPGAAAPAGGGAAGSGEGEE
jgi:nucleoid-associated protein YgaU